MSNQTEAARQVGSANAPSLDTIRIDLMAQRDILSSIRGLAAQIESALEGDQPRLQTGNKSDTVERATPSGMVGQMSQQLSDNISESHSTNGILENIVRLVGQG